MSDHVKISDLYLAAFLLTKGVELTGVEEMGTRKFFVFEGSKASIKDLEIVYSSRASEEAKVSALDFADNIRSMKRLCHS